MTAAELKRRIAAGGLVRGTPPSRAEFLRAARAAGLGAHAVDCRGAATKEELLRRLAGALRFPEHFGMNLDALHDSLTDLVMEGPKKGTALLLEGFPGAGDSGRSRSRAWSRAILEVLEGAVRFLADRKLTLTVFVG